jgi:hypothetical protein
LNIILAFFALLALAGFLASLVAHVGGYMGIDQPFGLDPWPLHIGIFVVWIPAMLVSGRLTKNSSHPDSWKTILRACPAWVSRVIHVLFYYALASFGYFFLTSFLSPGIADESSIIRGFSGHWLFFYFAAFTSLYAAIRIADEDRVRLCGNGHIVGEHYLFCGECGSAVQ